MSRLGSSLVYFHQNHHNRHPIARPSGRGMGCLLWVQALIYVLPLSLKCCMHYRAILYRVITAIHCNWGLNKLNISRRHFQMQNLGWKQLWSYFHEGLLLIVQWTNVSIGWGNGLVPSRNKPLPQLMLTKIFITLHTTTSWTFRLKNYVDTVPADALAPWLTTSSSALIDCVPCGYRGVF